MAMISTQLRNFREPTKDQLTQLFFSLPLDAQVGVGEKVNEQERMDISAVLTLGQDAEEDPYVSVNRSMLCCQSQRSVI